MSPVICSLTSGSIFASTKLPLTTWFLAIYLMTQPKDGISSLNLARSLGVSANAALRIKHKLQQVMIEEDDSLPLQNHVQLDDAYWGGQRHDGWPGRGASGKTPFLAAVYINAEGHPIAMRLSRVAHFSAAEIGSWCQKHLHHRSSIVSDGMRGSRGLAKAGFDHAAVVTGGGYKSMEIKELSLGQHHAWQC